MKNYNKSNKGFVLVLAILLLLVMSLMGTTLVVIASNDHKGNTLRDNNQQTFYAAESGIHEAKEWLRQQALKGITLGSHDLGSMNFCETGYFTSLSTNNSYVKAIGPANGSARKGWTSLTHLNSSNDPAQDRRLKKYQLEWFITKTPDENGKTTGPHKTKQVVSSSASGTNIAESRSASQQSSSMTDAYYYTIFSCGKGENDTIVALEAVVSLTQ